jgi:hypothetical protein
MFCVEIFQHLCWIEVVFNRKFCPIIDGEDGSSLKVAMNSSVDSLSPPRVLRLLRQFRISSNVSRNVLLLPKMSLLPGSFGGELSRIGKQSSPSCLMAMCRPQNEVWSRWYNRCCRRPYSIQTPSNKQRCSEANQNIHLSISVHLFGNWQACNRQGPNH